MMIQILDILIWPITLLIILFGFKQYVAHALKRINSFNAGVGGVSFTFSDKIAAAKEKINQLQNGQIAKSGGLLSDNQSTMVKELENELFSAIENKAKTVGVELESSIPKIAAEKLKETGIIPFETYQSVQIIDELIHDRAASNEMTDTQKSEIKQLIKNINL